MHQFTCLSFLQWFKPHSPLSILGVFPEHRSRRKPSAPQSLYPIHTYQIQFCCQCQFGGLFYIIKIRLTVLQIVVKKCDSFLYSKILANIWIKSYSYVRIILPQLTESENLTFESFAQKVEPMSSMFKSLNSILRNIVTPPPPAWCKLWWPQITTGCDHHTKE